MDALRKLEAGGKSGNSSRMVRVRNNNGDDDDDNDSEKLRTKSLKKLKVDSEPKQNQLIIPDPATTTCLPFERRLRITLSPPNQVAFPVEFSGIHLGSVRIDWK
ncbi:hypothetical protein J5N97_020345 [Dioscorea zingiberensis]|uniref:Uncharacterized protein n=1 Tax=Dioscorea zingiberensis TaxID=325984 RepID=A0A9D5CFP6_9LILI|nr:hypothetical protein J5N97_020345 [Dioscorea zingiberensis]